MCWRKTLILQEPGPEIVLRTYSCQCRRSPRPVLVNINFHLLTSQMKVAYSLSELPVVCSWNILGVDESNNTSHRKSSGGVDLDHGGVGLVGEHEGPVELILPLRDVPDVLGLSRRLPLGLHLLDRLAHRPEALVRFETLLPAGQASLQSDVVGSAPDCWRSGVAQDVQEELNINL